MTGWVRAVRILLCVATIPENSTCFHGGQIMLDRTPTANRNGASRAEGGAPAHDINPEGLDVDGVGRLIVRLSDEPSQEWCTFFDEYWASPSTDRSSTRRSVFQGWERSGPVFTTTVDDFVKNHRAVVKAAADHANSQMQGLAADRLAEATAAADAKTKGRIDLERERQKARLVTFD
jgi:hypothetical protein